MYPFDEASSKFILLLLISEDTLHSRFEIHVKLTGYKKHPVFIKLLVKKDIPNKSINETNITFFCRSTFKYNLRIPYSRKGNIKTELILIIIEEEKYNTEINKFICLLL
tara:strand:- start:39 stop:365 length:327 start_codon:yes stop_codon:yes gene_type:complete